MSEISEISEIYTLPEIIWEAPGKSAKVGGEGGFIIVALGNSFFVYW